MICSGLPKRNFGSSQKMEKREKANVAHEAILLSRMISEGQGIKITFGDGEYLMDHLKWHTTSQLGLRSGKVVSKSMIKYWEPQDV